MCDLKRRWVDKDTSTNRIAYSAWKHYFTKNHPNISSSTYNDFIKNHFYLSFMKYANYCINSKVVNVIFYLDYLVARKIPINKWCSDEHYSKFLTLYLKVEDINDAIKRSIETLKIMCDDQNIQIKDAFKYLNSNKLCQKIYQGQLSPWVLYGSDSGVNFLCSLNDDQVKIIYELVDPDIWRLKVFREKEKNTVIKESLSKYNL